MALFKHTNSFSKILRSRSVSITPGNWLTLFTLCLHEHLVPDPKRREGVSVALGNTVSLLQLKWL